MLRAVMRICRYGRPRGFVHPVDAKLRDGKPHPKAGQLASVDMLLKCGHIAFGRRDPWPRQPVQVHCGMCTFLYKEREDKDVRRRAKMMRREQRRIRQQMKINRQMKLKRQTQEQTDMAKKKMASKKVVAKKDLKKKGAKPKKEKGTKAKVGRKLMLVGSHLWAPKNSLISKVLKAMEAADEKIMGENELVAAMEKAGVKAEGKKTVKKLVKALLRNMLRAGVVVKQREIKHNEELKAFVGDADEAEEEDGDESEDEDGDEDESEDADEDAGDEDASEEDADEDEEEKPKAKKKVVKKKAKK